MVAIDLAQVLTQAVDDVKSVPLRTIKAARVLVADSEWVQAQTVDDRRAAIELARDVYNACQEWRRHCHLRRVRHPRGRSIASMCLQTRLNASMSRPMRSW